MLIPAGKDVIRRKPFETNAKPPYSLVGSAFKLEVYYVAGIPYVEILDNGSLHFFAAANVEVCFPGVFDFSDIAELPQDVLPLDEHTQRFLGLNVVEEYSIVAGRSLRESEPLY